MDIYGQLFCAYSKEYTLVHFSISVCLLLSTTRTAEQTAQSRVEIRVDRETIENKAHDRTSKPNIAEHKAYKQKTKNLQFDHKVKSLALYRLS
jgi:hypothetical protein